MNEEDNKRLKGQFFTIATPFNHDLFFKWYGMIENVEEEIFLEPFAGSNNIINMIKKLNLTQPLGWKSYDIEPPIENAAPEVIIEQRDTLSQFPSGYRVAITNPPYLAKNSATRRNMDFPDTEYDDLYKLSLSVMLENLSYVAAIIPESFINQNRFLGRLIGVISLNMKMFEDTTVPVCLALFGPDIQKDFEVYRGDIRLGKYSDIQKELNLFEIDDNTPVQKWLFNDKSGEIGLRCIDNSVEPSIAFIRGSDIDPSKIKHSSRNITRISGVSFESEEELDLFLDYSNKLLETYRDKTQDVFMTAFKGLREDKKYRRRLGFAEARVLLSKAFENTLKHRGESDE